jgi:D-alanyl-D-alanine carboxypeptidase/D-alanyl-D-alanine-endopeptidase (penicillin-binding protein 4)
MRFLATLGAAMALLAGTAATASAQPLPPAQRALAQSLTQSMANIGASSGAYVLDLNTGEALFAQSPTIGRNPASLEKIYTTSTALLRLGPTTTFTTSVLGVGSRDPSGVWNGTLYLRGGGDPTFGAAGFDRVWYGPGNATTMHSLIVALLKATGLTAVRGRIVGDASYFDSAAGTPATGYRRSSDVEGALNALAYDRGFSNVHATGFQSRPALFAAQQFAGGLRASRVKLLGPRFPISVGRTPAGATLLASVQSPPIAKLIALTNTPSDNYLAETLLKDIGARLGGGGTTAAGAAVVRAELLSQFGISPQLNDGSGLSRYDLTSPLDVVTVLKAMATNSTFVNSLAIGGETGTLRHEMNGTIAQGNCRGKTGTLSDAANLAGYCRASDGHTLVFAFLANGVGNTDYVHRVEAGMAVALAGYDG